MCIMTIVHYGDCLCYNTKVAVCAAHIAHTREQVDDMPCPEIIRRHIELNCKCTTYRYSNKRKTKCDGTPSIEWMFEDHTSGDWYFMEKGCTSNSKSQMEVDGMMRDVVNISCCMQEGRWLKGDRHDCDIGLGYWGSWRHLDDYGRVIDDGENSRQRGYKAVPYIKPMIKSAKECRDAKEKEEKRKRRRDRGRIHKKANGVKNEENGEVKTRSTSEVLEGASKNFKGLNTSNLERFNDLAEKLGSGPVNIGDWYDRTTGRRISRKDRKILDAARQDIMMAGAMSKINLKSKGGEEEMTDSVTVKPEIVNGPVKIQAESVESIFAKPHHKTKSTSGTFIRPEPTDDVFSSGPSLRKSSLDSLEPRIKGEPSDGTFNFGTSLPGASSIFAPKAIKSISKFMTGASPTSSTMFNFGENGNGFSDPPKSSNLGFSSAAPGAPGIRFTTPPPTGSISDEFDSATDGAVKVPEGPLVKRRVGAQRRPHTEPKPEMTA